MAARSGSTEQPVSAIIKSGFVPPPVGQRAELALHALLGALAHGAGVEHNQVGVIHGSDCLEAAFPQSKGNRRTLGYVHLAADRPDMKTMHVLRLPPLQNVQRC